LTRDDLLEQQQSLVVEWLSYPILAGSRWIRPAVTALAEPPAGCKF